MKKILRIKNSEILIVLLLTTCWCLWFAWGSVWSAYESERLVSTFNVDEGRNIILVSDALSKPFPLIRFTTYGHLYYNITLLPLFLVNGFIQIGDQAIIIAQRLTSLFSWALIIMLSFLLAKRFFGQLCAWLVFLLLATVSHIIIQYASISGPDMLQCFLFLLGLYFCCLYVELPLIRWVIGASVCAGLAFATKFGGVFLLPIMWILLFLRSIIVQEDLIRNYIPKLLQAIRGLLLVGGSLMVILCIVFTPEFVARYIDSEGILSAGQVKFVKNIRIVGILFGFFISILALVGYIWQWLKKKSQFGIAVIMVFISFVIFSLSFLVASPGSLLGLDFLKGLFFQDSLFKSVFWFVQFVQTNNMTVEWLKLLISDIGLILIILSGLSLIPLVFAALKREGSRFLSADFVLMMFIIIYLAFLCLRVGYLMDRYLIPIIPPIIILGAKTISSTFQWCRERIRSPYNFIVGVTMICVLLGMLIPGFLAHNLSFRQEMSTRIERSIRVFAGHWLENNYQPSTRILYDAYTYIPPSFSKVERVMGPTIEILEQVQPDIVIVNDAIKNRFKSKERADFFVAVVGPERYMKSYEYYRRLENEDFGYKIVKDFGSIKAYVRDDYK